MATNTQRSAHDIDNGMYKDESTMVGWAAWGATILIVSIPLFIYIGFISSLSISDTTADAKTAKEVISYVQWITIPLAIIAQLAIIYRKFFTPVQLNEVGMSEFRGGGVFVVLNGGKRFWLFAFLGMPVIPWIFKTNQTIRSVEFEFLKIEKKGLCATPKIAENFIKKEGHKFNLSTQDLKDDFTDDESHVQCEIHSITTIPARIGNLRLFKKNLAVIQDAQKRADHIGDRIMALISSRASAAMCYVGKYKDPLLVKPINKEIKKGLEKNIPGELFSSCGLDVMDPTHEFLLPKAILDQIDANAIEKLKQEGALQKNKTQKIEAEGRLIAGKIEADLELIRTKKATTATLDNIRRTGAAIKGNPELTKVVLAQLGIAGIKEAKGDVNLYAMNGGNIIETLIAQAMANQTKTKKGKNNP